jgi:hypothetical protein
LSATASRSLMSAVSNPFISHLPAQSADV